MSVLGLDIGGANLKVADESGRAVSRPFPIWREPDRLHLALADLINQFGGSTRLAVTMTAELADCYSTKSEGVRSILSQVDMSLQGAERAHLRTQVAVWSTAGKFVTPAEAHENPLSVAAANWHALATWVASQTPLGTGLLIDIGSTTTDVIPLHQGRPVAEGSTDLTRLLAGELCYTGTSRTPLCTIALSVPFRQTQCPLAAEVFATTLDVYLTLGQIAENPENCETANGKPATKSAAHDRLARMICGDRDEISIDETYRMAQFLADVQRQRLLGSIDRVVRQLPGKPSFLVLTGSGQFLAKQLSAEHPVLADCEIIELPQLHSAAVSTAACAYAAGQLLLSGNHESQQRITTSPHHE